MAKSPVVQRPVHEQQFGKTSISACWSDPWVALLQFLIVALCPMLQQTSASQKASYSMERRNLSLAIFL